jgi:hypothetical protein
MRGKIGYLLAHSLLNDGRRHRSSADASQIGQQLAMATTAGFHGIKDRAFVIRRFDLDRLADAPARTRGNGLLNVAD